MTEITALWNRIETWLEKHGELRQLRPPATEEQLAEAEEKLGLTFPADLRESLLRHDGVMPDAWPDMYPMRLQYMVTDTLQGRRTLTDIWAEDAQAARLLLVADGGDGSYLALQVSQSDELYFFEGHLDGVYYPNWTAFLANMADGLDSGRYVLADEEFRITEYPDGSYVVRGPNPVPYRPLQDVGEQ